MRVILGLLVVSAVAVTALASQAPPPAADLAKRLQDRYATVRDFTADFTHTHKSGVLPKPRTERGQVKVKKPSRMRWTYVAPEKKEFVADGRTMHMYWPADKIVREEPLPTGDTASTALLFLSGRGNLTRDFSASLSTSQPADAWQLDLKPRTAQPDFVTLSLLVERDTLKLRGMMTVDAQGGTNTYQFANLRENVNLADADFVFVRPKGAHVVKLP